MNARVTEFQCIMPLENIPSVLKLGILSNERAAKVPHHSVAMEDVQERRDLKHVPGGLKLHQYANLYFHARNPMLYKRKDDGGRICASCGFQRMCGILPVWCLPTAMRRVAYVRFLHPSQEQVLDYDSIFAMDWNGSSERSECLRAADRRNARKCWCPIVVEPKYLTGAYVVEEAVGSNLQSLGFGMPVTIDPEMFFH